MEGSQRKFSWSELPRTNYIDPMLPRWQLISLLNQADAFPINEECDCDGGEGVERERCRCSHRSLTLSSTPRHTHPMSLAPNGSSLNEIDGVDDILAVSHVQEKAVVPHVKSKPPLVRAKTLPAIIAPGLTIIHSQMSCADDGSSPTKDGYVDSSERHCSNRSNETCRKKPRSSPSKATLLVNNPGSSPWKSSSAIDPQPASASLLVNTPSLSLAHSAASSQVGIAGIPRNNEKMGFEHQSGNVNSWMGFAKLARFLNQREKEKSDFVESTSGFRHSSCRRTHSLENDDVSVRKASSIDSLVVDPGYLGERGISSAGGISGGKEPKSIPNSPSYPSRLERPCADLQSSPSLHYRMHKSKAGWSRESVEYVADALNVNKTERKKLEKVNKINIHMHALFLAVEHQQLDRARTILEHADLDINGLNSDGFNALDIAVFTQNVPLSKLLLSYGAKENSKYNDPKYCDNYIKSLIRNSEQNIENLTASIINTPVNSSVSNSHHLKDNEKQLMLWERRFRLLKKMKIGFEQTRPPDPPSSVILLVVGTTNLLIQIEEPDFQSGAIVTKYRVEWSCREDFNSIEGTEELVDLRSLNYVITGLQSGSCYFVRVTAGNVKGYSSHKYSSPVFAVPSSWRDLDGRQARTVGRLNTMDDLFNQIRNSRPEYASEIKALADQLDTPAQLRKNQMKKSIKSLFTPAPKFYKHLKRGVFLSAIFYKEDQILVTSEEYLPVVEVDETYPSSLHTDFHWMMKVACTWDDVKSLRQDMDRSLSSSTVHFRSRLLQAAAQMQSALGVQDLGQFFYRPIKDKSGTLVIGTICSIKDIKSVNAISMKWIPISKLRRKLTLSVVENGDAGDMLLASISEQIQYSQRSQNPIHRGLYLGYVKLKSSMDLIRVLVPENTPNVLPHYRIRENPHVSCEEWSWLKSLHLQQLSDNSQEAPSSEDAKAEEYDEAHCYVNEDTTAEERDEEESLDETSSGSTCPTSEVQLQFGRQVLSAAKHLFGVLKVNKEDARLHRLFDVEVIELSADVAFVLVLPSVENVCSIPGQGGDEEIISRQGFLALPVQVFEMIHMSTYQHDFINRYSRLSSILEMDTVMAHHAHREAFSSSEVVEARQRLVQLQDFQQQVDNTWKEMRWIMDVLTYARDKLANGGMPMTCLYDRFDVRSPMVDLAFGYRNTNTIRSSMASGRSMDSIHFRPNLATGRIRCSSSGNSPFRAPYPETLHGHTKLQVPYTQSPSFPAKVSGPCGWRGKSKSKRNTASIPKSLSDSFSSTGIRDVTVTLNEHFGAFDGSNPRSCVMASLTPSLRSSSSGELPAEEEGAVNWSSQLHHSPRRNLIRSEPRSITASSDNVVALNLERRSEAIRPKASTSLDALGHHQEPGILRVYAAYETGLGGTSSIRLHVTPQTTAREVINLVVRQLNMAAALKSGTAGNVNAQEQLQLYCLVAVIGARERCLRDDFCPLKLQNPWTSGRLYVRMKHEVLAALEDNSNHINHGRASSTCLPISIASSDASLSLGGDDDCESGVGELFLQPSSL